MTTENARIAKPAASVPTEAAALRKFVGAIDKMNTFIANQAYWLVAVLILLTIFLISLRYFFHSSVIWGYDMSEFIGLSLVLGWGYVEIKKANVRIDIFYDKFSPKGKAWTDVICFVIFGVPVLGFGLYGAIKYFFDAIRLDEKITESFWYPPAWPIRLIVLISVVTVILQFLCTFLRDLYFVTKGKKL